MEQGVARFADASLLVSGLAGFLALHLGHFPVGLAVSAVLFLLDASPTDDASTIAELLKSVRPRQQHEIPPKIWLYAKAKSKTYWKGIKDIEFFKTD